MNETVQRKSCSRNYTLIAYNVLLVVALCITLLLPVSVFNHTS